MSDKKERSSAKWDMTMSTSRMNPSCILLAKIKNVQTRFKARSRELSKYTSIVLVM
jgi:hypothetical protein